MGIPGLMKEIGKGDRIALAKLALDHFEKHKRPLRIAIDAAIWNFQTQYGGAGGKNPALRTLYFRLLRLLALPIHPVFVYDGKNKPLTKRGKTVSRYGTCVPAELSKNLVARFQFPHHVAPGEAEAECAFLQKQGTVDAVMTQDVDAMMFGSGITLRNWSKEGTKGNKAPTHVDVLDISKIKEQSGLDQSGMILVALLNGGDYHDGISGFGPSLSCEVARAGFGRELIDLINENDEQGVAEWRERLQYELECNESGYFAKRHKTVKVPDDFPSRKVLDYYLNPAISEVEDLPKLERRWLQWWDREIEIPALREYVAMTFDWLYRKGATHFIRSMAQPLFQHRLKTGVISESQFETSDIKDSRKHFTMDGAAELRITVNPLNTVGIDMAEEEEDPEFAVLEDDADDLDMDGEAPIPTRSADEPSNSTTRKQKSPWDPSNDEKWWVPEAILRHGLPSLMSKRDQEQADIANEPVKFAMRKAKPAAKTTTKARKTIDSTMKSGAIHTFMPVSKDTSNVSVQQSTKAITEDRVSKAKREPFARSKSNPLTSMPPEKINIAQFFKAKKPDVVRGQKGIEQVPEDRAVGPIKKGSISTILDSCLEDFDLSDLEDICDSNRNTKFGRSSTLPTDAVLFQQPDTFSVPDDEYDIEAEFLEDSMLSANQLANYSNPVHNPQASLAVLLASSATVQSRDKAHQTRQPLSFTPTRPSGNVIDLTTS